jgi:hypothetical protein
MRETRSLQTFRRAYSASSPEVQLSILAELSHELTILLRSFYTDDTQGQHVPAEVAIAINELQHLITGQQRHLSKDEQQRYPDEVFLSILVERGSTSILKSGFSGCITTVVDRFPKE